jgi:N-acetylglutamate synthase-like GNAT family acetyltransferase
MLEVSPGAYDRDGIEAFYRAQLGRTVTLDPTDEPIVARDGSAIVGALRLHHRAGTLILRTVVVAEGRRAHGIGTLMLDAADQAIGARECYCFPWTHLERFYGRIGLRRIPTADVPPPLRDLLGEGCIPTRREARP